MWDERRRNRPDFAVNVGALAAAGVRVRANCDTCGRFREVNVRLIARRRGDDFDLWDKRSHCRLTAGCAGVVHYSYFGGSMFRNMYG